MIQILAWVVLGVFVLVFFSVFLLIITEEECTRRDSHKETTNLKEVQNARETIRDKADSA